VADLPSGDHLVFTGGTETGRRVMQAAAANLVPLTLELGGKCPALVLPGADLARAAQAILAGKVVNAGQTCIAPDTVLLVGHTPADFAAACRATGIGLPDTVVVNDRQAARLEALCEGATLTPLGSLTGSRPMRDIDATSKLLTRHTAHRISPTTLRSRAWRSGRMPCGVERMFTPSASFSVQFVGTELPRFAGLLSGEIATA